MEFIMEEELIKIKNKCTREFVQEVISCYHSGNYRAAVVLLHTAIKKQKENPNDSKWEEDLIKRVCEETNIINQVEKEKLLNLKKERNFAAHPIVYFSENDVTNEIELVKPQVTSKETAKDLIRKGFEIVFLSIFVISLSLS